MRKWILVALLACVGTPGSCAQGTSYSDVESKMAALENLWNRALEGRDLKALNIILDDDFVQVDSDGRLRTKAKLLADLKTSDGVRFLSETMVVHLHGDTAVVTGIYQVKVVERGKGLLRRERFVDTWRYKDGMWTSIARLATPVGS